MTEAIAWPNQIPLRVVTWLLRPHTGRVLDLFSGTGTTREAAMSLGLPVVSVDLSPAAVALTRTRKVQLGLAVQPRRPVENLTLD
jgi:methylase of polypeptide subunit release factors